MLGDLKRNSPKLRLYAEFAANIRHVQKYYDENAFATSRLPTMWPDQVESVGDNRSNEYFTVGIFGSPRRDKGKYRLAPIFAAFLKQARAMNIRRSPAMLIQNDGRFDRAMRLRASLAAKLRTDIGKVRFLPAEMTSADFISHLRQCDVVLLPYIREAYERRGSGVMVDAVAHGIPVICQSETAMCELIESGNGLAASSDSEFVECLVAMATNPDRYRQAAREAARFASDRRSDALLTALCQVQHKAV